MNIETPKGWRKGQTIFNFLVWLKSNKDYSAPTECLTGRMADPFYIPDDELDKLFKEFLEATP